MTTTAATSSDTFEYVLPSLGADMDAGRVVEWRVAVGDEVHRGDVVAVVETEKSDIDIEIWHDGVVEELLVELHVEIPVGTPVALLRRLDAGDGDEGGDEADVEPAPEEAAEEAAAPAASEPAAEEVAPERPPVRADRRAATSSPAVRPTDGERVPASPLARRLASERGIDLAALTGSGPGGAVVERDVLAARAPSPATTSDSPAPERRPAGTSTDSMRALIAERMSTANRDIPHYFLARDVDVSALLDLVAAENADRPIAERLLPAAFYVRAVALATAQHPQLNGFWRDGGFEPGDGVHVAMAVSLRKGGLVTPKVADADQCSVDEIMAMLREFVTAARTGKLKGSWMTGSTITVTNLGDQGADLVHGVISPPQVALVGAGAVRDRPWVVDGDVVARPILTLTLAADHRATDGAVGARFLGTIADLLETPTSMKESP